MKFNKEAKEAIYRFLVGWEPLELEIKRDEEALTQVLLSPINWDEFDEWLES